MKREELTEEERRKMEMDFSREMASDELRENQGGW